MNGAAGEKQETEKRIKEYIQASSMDLSKKEERDFKELVIQNEETAKKVFRGSNHTGKAYILIYLNSQGKGADIAKEEAETWAGQMEFINSNVSEEQAFRSWLCMYIYGKTHSLWDKKRVCGSCTGTGEGDDA